MTRKLASGAKTSICHWSEAVRVVGIPVPLIGWGRRWDHWPVQRWHWWEELTKVQHLAIWFGASYDTHDTYDSSYDTLLATPQTSSDWGHLSTQHTIAIRIAVALEVNLVLDSMLNGWLFEIYWMFTVARSLRWFECVPRWWQKKEEKEKEKR